VRLLLPRSGYAPQQKSGPQEVGITAEGDNSTLGGHFLAGWSVLHVLAHTPLVPRSQVDRRHARYYRAWCRRKRGGRRSYPASSGASRLIRNRAAPDRASRIRGRDQTRFRAL